MDLYLLAGGQKRAGFTCTGTGAKKRDRLFFLYLVGTIILLVVDDNDRSL